jgi:hypothetical protein
MKRGAPRRSPSTKAGAGGMPGEITQKYDINTCAKLTEKQFFFCANVFLICKKHGKILIKLSNRH